MRIRKALAALPAVACMLAYAPWAGAQTSVLDKVKSSGTLKVCFAQGMPDNFKDPKTGRWLDETRFTIEGIDWLTAADKQMIFEDNAKKVFNLKEPL